MPRAAPDTFKPKSQAVEKAFYPIINPAYRNPRINERVLNRHPDSHKKELPYTHGILLPDED